MMQVGRLLVAVLLCGILSDHAAVPQTAPKLTLDTTKPFAYIEFDHTGHRVPEADDEPSKGLWLRLVNNSVFPILVRVHNSQTVSDRMIIEDLVTAFQIRRIPKSGFVDYGPMPMGYTSASDVAGTEKIDPGKEFLFSVPTNHVAPAWYLQVPFQFDLPPTKHGAAQPICYAAFTWDDIPEKLREPGSAAKPTTH
jgi:hypothetical protein